MIDIEYDVYSAVKNGLPSSINCKQYYQKSERQFPLVTVEEINNAEYEDGIDSSCDENFVTVGYEVNIYTNTGNKKSECKTLAKSVDSIMRGIGFTRIYSSPIPNQDDSTIFRIVCRYNAVVDKNKQIYRR